MKKLIALALASAFALPTFAFSIKIGDEIAYVPVRGVSKAYVTKIAPLSDGMFELEINADEIAYTYIVQEGDELDMYSKAPKAKNSYAKKLTIQSIDRNKLEAQDTTPTNTYTDAK